MALKPEKSILNSDNFLKIKGFVFALVGGLLAIAIISGCGRGTIDYSSKEYLQAQHKRKLQIFIASQPPSNQERIRRKMLIDDARYNEWWIDENKRIFARRELERLKIEAQLRHQEFFIENVDTQTPSQ